MSVLGLVVSGNALACLPHIVRREPELDLSASFQIALTTPSAPLRAPRDGLSRGKARWDANGKRVGTINRVNANGSVNVIVGEKIVTVQATSLTSKDGKAVTSAAIRDLKRM